MIREKQGIGSSDRGYEIRLAVWAATAKRFRAGFDISENFSANSISIYVLFSQHIKHQLKLKIQY